MLAFPDQRFKLLALGRAQSPNLLLDQALSGFLTGFLYGLLCENCVLYHVRLRR